MVCKYFPSFCRFPFHFVDYFLRCAELFSLMQSHLFIFAFVAFAFGVKYKKLSPSSMSRSLLPIFSSRYFLVSGKWDSFLSLSCRSLLVYRNVTDFCILILYPANLLNLFIISNRFFWWSLQGFLYTLSSHLQIVTVFLFL